MKKKLIYLLLVIATVLILAGPVLAGGDNWMGLNENGTGTTSQYIYRYQYGKP